MFIYQKNKVNEVTGQVEQSLNVTFEGNKPVETPDVVITKDGVTGIKSDSNAYMFITPFLSSSISSYIIDGESQTFNIDGGFDTISTLFTKSAGINITSRTGMNRQYYITKNNNSVSYVELTTKEGNSLIISSLGTGQYIFDYENKIYHTPTRDYSFNELSDAFNSAIENSTFAGIAFNHYETNS